MEWINHFGLKIMVSHREFRDNLYGRFQPPRHQCFYVEKNHNMATEVACALPHDIIFIHC